ncbi:zinc finger CCCH domain-containing protein 38-like [Impatiens glandulifera]|uniref:zinc finger CCCH domain-containing protein 38-like n=1 Tax=Impatiens glandulifera TaxID=253017 RepID=UPI001FB17F9C|nr:zinc finger CCCH domain-containing protein 38-like [Impatiens glandulifera]XP_047338226.1 zinc finger CCCH domain-containing protein 38-like [Impatiens glandulifera]
MSERIRRYSSKWDHKKKPELSLQHTRGTFSAKRDKYASNESHAWHLQQVDHDNAGKHDKTLKETGASTLLDAPLPWDEHESYGTRMSPGLDDWRRQKHKRSPESGWCNSSYRNSTRRRSRSPPKGFNQDKRLDGRRVTAQSHNLLSGRHTRSEFPINIAKNDTKSLKTFRFPVTDGQKVESSDIRNGNSGTLVGSAQERPKNVSRQRDVGRDMDAFLFKQKKEFEPYHSEKYSRLSYASSTARSQNNERRNITLNKFDKHTNQNQVTGISDIIHPEIVHSRIVKDASYTTSEREEQHNWGIDKCKPWHLLEEEPKPQSNSGDAENWLEGMEISSPWNPRQSSSQQGSDKASTRKLPQSYNAFPRRQGLDQNIQNDSVLVSNPSTLNFTIENKQMLQRPHILPVVVDMNEAQEKELRESKTTRFNSSPVEGNNMRANSQFSLTQRNHSDLVTFSPSSAQLAGARQQLPQPYTALNFSKSLESIVPSINNSLVKCNSEVQPNKEGEKLECLNLIAADCSTSGKVNVTNDPDSEENKIGGEANLSSENGNETNDEKKTRGNMKGILRAFKFALAEFVKKILKPKWKDGVISKDFHNAVVKKVVDKVMGSIPHARIPRSQERITNYLALSESKLDKLVKAYVDKHDKT